VAVADNTVVASRYRVVRELGRGGMGVVYVVEHARTGEQAALKVLHRDAAQDPQAIERFKREAKASGRIKSDHVVRILDADVAPELDGAPFLVMELLDGEDLDKRVEQQGRLSSEEVLRYLNQAARALDKAHAVGIVHRDLKPENLFLHRREDGSTILKILDFGISKTVGGNATGDLAAAGVTSTGAIMGTPLYMAPEQARGRASEIGPATDVWAVGLIAQYLLTGDVYWRANTVAELMVEILSDPFYPPTQRWTWLPAAFDAWFLRSCSRSPNERFSSVGQQIDALAAVLEGRAPVVTSTAASRPGGATLQAPAHSGPRLSLDAASTVGATTAGASRDPSRSASGRGGVVAAAAVVLIASAGTAALVTRGHSRAGSSTADPANPVAAAAAPPGSAGAALPGSVQAAPPGAPAGTPASPDDSPSIASTANPGSSSHLPAPTAGRPAAPAAAKPRALPIGTTPSSAPAAAKPAAPTVNCNPPYDIDSSGHKQYKPECL
jgi:serine/threonine-protein kinase